MTIDRALVDRLHRQANAERWRVSARRFAVALESSVQHMSAGQGRPAELREIERYLGTLHLEDLALACACADGDEGAWEHFVLEQRPLLYRAADALAPGGSARDLADSLYADLFGLREREGERLSLFRYFHGRSSLTTWLRAVLAQRHVDRLRSNQRLDALPDEASPHALSAPPQAIDPDRGRYLEMIRHALGRAVAALPPRDRLRLACYYAQGLTLAETGKIVAEHEATTSRQLARTRKVIRHDVEHQLAERGLTAPQVAHCFDSVTEDAGAIDLKALLKTGAERKESALDRSS